MNLKTNLLSKAWEKFLGLNDTELETITFEDHKDYLIHQDIRKDLESLIKKASSFQIKLQPISSFRPFERQLKIWNEKVSGTRPLIIIGHNGLEEKIDPHSLSESELLWAILKWSAIPGLSRHHWGTDLDMIDQKALDLYNKKKQHTPYQIKLTPSEYQQDGIFSHLGSFLEQQKISPFYRPYHTNRKVGLAFEPWHISHQQLANEKISFLKSEGLSRFLEILQSEIYKDLKLKEVIISNLDTIMTHYILNY